MKKMIALFLTMLLLAALSACAPQAESGTEDTFTVPSDDASYVYTPAEDAEPLPGGATIALAAESGALEEAWGVGTAAVVSPMGVLAYKDVEHVINDNKIGELTQRLYDELTGIQWGKVPDTRGWIVKVC